MLIIWVPVGSFNNPFGVLEGVIWQDQPKYPNFFSLSVISASVSASQPAGASVREAIDRSS
jgi:hypothetical protein